MFESPMQDLTKHKNYDAAYVMILACGQSADLKYRMDDALHAEINRALWLFFLSLFGGSSVCFIVFSIIFERRLQIRVTKPISELSKQIKNPKEFMAARIKSLDFYGRKST